jgi:hypothetical protein
MNSPHTNFYLTQISHLEMKSFTISAILLSVALLLQHVAVRDQSS